MTRLRELIEKAATAALTEDERQELQRHFLGLAQREADIVQIIRAEEAEEIADDDSGAGIHWSVLDSTLRNS